MAAAIQIPNVDCFSRGMRYLDHQGASPRRRNIMSAKLNLIALALGTAALVSTPALAAWHHSDRTARAREAESAYAYAPAGQGHALTGPTMTMIQNHIPVGAKQVPGFNSKP
jgi:hypothetical protein